LQKKELMSQKELFDRFDNYDRFDGIVSIELRPIAISLRCTHTNFRCKYITFNLIILLQNLTKQRMKKTLVYSGLIFLSTLSLNQSIAQKGAEVNRTTVETKFYRPSLTNLFIQPKSSEARVVVDEFKKLDLEKRFDNNGVANNTISVTLPEPPQMPTSQDAIELVKLMKEYKKAMKVYEEQKSLAIQKQVKPITKQVIAKWWNRDASGNMSDELILQRGMFSATDRDVIQDGTSEIARRANIGYELIKRSYITVYEITDVKSMDQVYNERDAAARIAAQKSKTEFKPVPRTQEGYQASYNAITYKIVWNDSVQSVFFDKFWVDKSTASSDRSTKVNAFENSDYPLVQVASLSGKASSIQSNDPKTYSGLLGKTLVRKTMDQLLHDMSSSIQENAMFKTTKLVEDFQTKAPIFVTYPTQVKIGTKEGIYIDERFMVYQKFVDPKTKMESKKKIGMVRVKSIADNDVVANGDSKASLFQQQAGKKLNSGNFVQMKEDLGISVMIGYGVGDNSMGGVYASLDQRVSRYFKNKFARGVYFTFGANMAGFTDQNIILGDTTYSGTAINFSLGIGKEIYFTKRGHLFLYPSVGYSIHSLTLNKRQGKEISADNFKPFPVSNSSTSYSENDYSWTNGGLLASLGIGYNFSASFSLLIRPSISYKLGEYTTGNDLELPAATTFSNAWNMDKVSDMSIPIYIGLRYKF